MNLLAQILSSKVQEIERKTGFAIGTVRQPGLEDAMQILRKV